MNHDELVKKHHELQTRMDSKQPSIESGKVFFWAIRQVMWLHRPLEGTVVCHSFCQTDEETGWCKTVQAIEEELNRGSI